MRRPASVRARSALAAALATALVLGLGGWWLRADTQARWDRSALETATSDAFALTSALEGGEPLGPGVFVRSGGPVAVVFADGSFAVAGRPFTELDDRPLVPLPPATGWTVRHVRFPARAVAPRADSDGLRADADGLRHRDATLAVGVTGVLSTDRVRAVTGVAGKPPQRLTVYRLASQESTDLAVATLDRFTAWGFPAAMLFVGAVAWAVTGRALRPVDAIRAKMDVIGASGSGQRVPVPAGSLEIARLARSTNRTLDRLEHTLDRQRRFVADASHELRSPLSGLRGTLEIALVHPGEADWRAVVAQALADAVRLQALTDDLLLLASAERSPDGETTDLADLVEEQVAERACAEADLTFTASVRGPAVVRGGEIRLGRVLRNLLDNAARHARAEVRVTVGASAGRATLTVADDGPGVPAADRERIFDRFVRLDDARARATGGAGLGLTIVRDIVTALGGTVHTTPGAPGACFVVSLPLLFDASGVSAGRG
ncbi:sensor histidine kinase [Actinomadura harenae]|uniref:histidine kinase n=1 Tax=Actinomadura harenae TaxID=2483351 RepID=A0A3M2M978_9ACTN|nr:HAMP domain-containing sensor histidine kinase [Actinomadura harenae]RMI45433.1 sensor histidine kinase [Actinomadura harenae]